MVGHWSRGGGKFHTMNESRYNSRTGSFDLGGLEILEG